MNIMRIYKHKPAWMGLLLASLLMVLSSQAAEKTPADISGTWISDPELAQLGLIQVTYSFNKDGTFKHKLNFLSFCGIGAITPDCQYFWHVTEGRYTADSKALHLHFQKGFSQLLYQGQMVPLIRDMGLQPGSEDIQAMIDEQGNLVLSDKQGKLHSFKPVLATEGSLKP